jgi:hypothetical protein
MAGNPAVPLARTIVWKPSWILATICESRRKTVTISVVFCLMTPMERASNSPHQARQAPW